jgi:hypothetical protein
MATRARELRKREGRSNFTSWTEEQEEKKKQKTLGEFIGEDDGQK